MAALALLFLCQCTSMSRAIELGKTDQVEITFAQGGTHGDGLTQTLVSRAQLSAKDAYSGGRAQPSLKVAPLPDLQGLIDEFARHNFFEKARPAPPQRAKQLLTLTVNGKPNVLAMLPADMPRNPADLNDFIACKNAFRQVFNLHPGFSSSGSIHSDEVERRRANFRERSKNIQEQPKENVGQMPKWGHSPPEKRGKRPDGTPNNQQGSGKQGSRKQ